MKKEMKTKKLPLILFVILIAAFFSNYSDFALGYSYTVASQSGSTGVDLIFQNHPTGTSFNSALGESFNCSVTSYLVVASAHITLYNKVTGYLTAKLYLSTGTYGSQGVPTGGPLATSASKAVSVVNDGVVDDFFFDGTYQMIANTKYVITWELTGSTDTSNAVAFDYTSSTSSYSGNQVSYYSGGWAYMARDLEFYVYGNANPTDNSAPTFGSITANTTLAGQPFKLSNTVSDNVAVDKVIYSTNKTGSWTNETALSGSGTSYVANLTGTWSSTAGTVVQAKVYANDTSNNWNSSSVYSFTLTAPAPTASPPPAVTPSPTPMVTPRIIEVPNEPITLYFRSDTYSTVGNMGYGLDVDHTNTAAQVSDSMAAVGSVVYGFRVFLVTNNVTQTELTSGTPIGQVTRSANGSGLQTADWNAPATNVLLGYQALKVIVYMNYGGSGWIARAIYLSGILVTGHIAASTWTFKLYTNYTEDGSNTYSTFYWDSSSYKSGIYNVVFTKPLESEVQLWRFNRGDWIGFEIGAYVDMIGEAFYVLLLLLFAGSLYFRYGHFGTVAFFFIIFGGPGGLVWFLVPAWAAAVTSIIIILGTSFIVWRVIR